MRLCHRRAGLPLIVCIAVLLFPLGARAWHFEVVSTGGTLFAETSDYVLKPFNTGQVTATQSDTGGNGTARTDFSVRGDTCSFHATATGSASGYFGNGEAIVGSTAGAGNFNDPARFTLRVVADEGDVGGVNIIINWEANSEGEDGFPCGSLARVEGSLIVEEYENISMYTHCDLGPQYIGDVTSIGPVPDETLIHFSGGLWGIAGTMDFCSRTGSSSVSIFMLLEEGSVPVENTTWGNIKRLFQ